MAALAALALVAFVGCSSGTAASQASTASASSASSASAASATAAAGSQSAAASSVGTAGEASELQPGVYTVRFETDSTMFHVNEADEGKARLTVANDGMRVYFRLESKKIVNVYPGTAEQARADESGVVQPITDTVTYSDGTQKEVYAFEVPVPALDQEFDVAILGEKGTWYDHMVSVSHPIQDENR